MRQRIRALRCNRRIPQAGTKRVPRLVQRQPLPPKAKETQMGLRGPAKQYQHTLEVAFAVGQYRFVTDLAPVVGEPRPSNCLTLA